MGTFLYTSRFYSSSRLFINFKVPHLSPIESSRRLTTYKNNSSDSNSNSNSNSSNNSDSSNNSNSNSNYNKNAESTEHANINNNADNNDHSKDDKKDTIFDDDITSTPSEPIEEDIGERIKVYIDEIDSLKRIVKEKDHIVKELQDAYLRSLADQENMRQRNTTEINATKEYAIQKFAKELLDTVDILGLALTSVPVELRKESTAKDWEKAKDPEALIHQLTTLYMGISMMESELMKTLRRNGIEPFDPMNEKFDPNQHQALFQASLTDKEPGSIFSVQKLGYKMKNRILRPAQVGVVSDK